MKKFISIVVVSITIIVAACGNNNDKNKQDTYMPAPGSDSATVDSNRTNGYPPPNADTTDTLHKQ
jgi:hypothetical protein